MNFLRMLMYAVATMGRKVNSLGNLVSFLVIGYSLPQMSLEDWIKLFVLQPLLVITLALYLRAQSVLGAVFKR